MALLELAPSRMAAESLEMFSNPFDVRRDLHTFVRYVRDRQVKRSHRGNELPKADVQRLLQTLSDAGRADRLDEQTRQGWLACVDALALALGFVSYDTKGSYAGYSSAEPSFPDNMIRFNADAYARFLVKPLQGQEDALLGTLVGSYSYSDNEFFVGGAVGELDGFNSFGCATGVLPGIDFAKARRTLLGILSKCRPGVWYETASLVQHLKREEPWFLIPEKPSYQHAWEREGGRYGNFRESGKSWGSEVPIAQADPDAFERVEGRYVERFLDGIPLTLGYVDAAYGESTSKLPRPSLNRLRAFRVSETVLRVMGKTIRQPKITVQPDFSIHVESELYPASVLEKLAPLADIVALDRVSILKLSRKKVVARLAQDDSLDAAGLLAALSGAPLPQNVRAELEEWAGHSEAFTLYEGFGLWEADADLPGAKPFAVRDVATGEAHKPLIRIVRSPHAVVEALEQAGLVPVLVRHSVTALAPLPQGTISTFRSRPEGPAEARKKKEEVALSRRTTATLFFPTSALLEECRKAMIQVGCPIEAEASRKTISYAVRHAALAEAGLKLLRKTYDVRIQDLEP